MCSLWLKKLRAAAPSRAALPSFIRLLRRQRAVLSSFLFLLSALSASTAAPASLDSLVARSPFKPLAVEAARAPAAPSRVEFGGFMVENGQPLVSLTDLAKGTSHWVALRDPRAAYFVETLDRAAGTLSLRLDGRLVTLALRRASADAVPGAAPAAPASPGAIVLNAASGPDEPPSVEPAAPGAPNRIPPTRLKIPPRADDPK